MTLTGHVRVVSADVQKPFPCVHYNIFDAEDVSCEFELLEDDPFYRRVGLDRCTNQRFCSVRDREKRKRRCM